MTTIYVGNLPFNATEQDLRALFERHGTVESVKLINDRETGKPRGFGFVDMAQADAQTAIQALLVYVYEVEECISCVCNTQECDLSRMQRQCFGKGS